MKKLIKHLSLMLIGGVSYYMIEILYRGYSHFSMFLLGSICFLLIGLINEFYSFEMPLWKQQSIATIIITILEFVFGVVLNIVLNLNVWNYSLEPFNIMGQVCLRYSIYWFFLSAIAIIIDDYLRYWLFNEEKPYYKLI